METKWQLQDAKNRFSELVEKAINLGPQTVNRRGVDAVVVLAVDDYKKLTRSKSNLLDFFKNSPLHNVDLDLKRDKGLSREVEF